MTRKTKINLIISTIIVFIYFFVGHLYVKDSDQSEWGYFFIVIYAGTYSIIVGIVTLILDFITKRFWNNILFITSCLTNIVLTLGTLFGDGSNFLLTTFLLTILIPIAQIVLFIIRNKTDRLLYEKT